MIAACACTLAAVLGLPLGTRTVFATGDRFIDPRLFRRFARDTFGPVLALPPLVMLVTIGTLPAGAAIASAAMFGGLGFAARFGAEGVRF